jgi:LytS/YehU family sensor histidine kinase
VVCDFVIKAILTLPIWYLFFVRLSKVTISRKLLLHLITLPLFVIIWGLLHRASAGWVGYTRFHKMDSKSAIWFEYYLPMVFYLIQFGIFHAYQFWKESQWQQQKEKELLQLAYQSEVNVLKAQIQPHFLFNTLNSISASVPPEQEKTRELIAKLADTFRFSLKSSQLELVPLHEEIDFIQNCLELEQHRFGKRLAVEYHLDEQIADVLVPPMLLQPIVENAIKHGIAPSIKGGKISITCVKDKNRVLISVSDTGIGRLATFYDNDFNGIGLKNTSSRLWRLYEEKIKIENNEPSGLRFSFHLPIESK